MIKEYLNKIIEKDNDEDMQKLTWMLKDLLKKIEESDYDLYQEYRMCLYEMAYGQVLSKDMAQEWIYAMRPFGMKWSYEQTTSILEDRRLSVEPVDFWAIMNAMYNDYSDTLNEDVEMYIKLSVDFLKDADAKPGKIYNYWKYIVAK